MTLLLILFAIVLLAVVAPYYGVDSRDLTDDGPDSPPAEDKLWSRRT